jgi:hypothetical protein
MASLVNGSLAFLLTKARDHKDEAATVGLLGRWLEPLLSSELIRVDAERARVSAPGIIRALEGILGEEMTNQCHLLLHIPDQLLRFGPASSFWMYAVESLFGSYLKPLALNRRYLEGSIAARLSMHQFLLIASLLLKIPSPALNPPPPLTTFNGLAACFGQPLPRPVDLQPFWSTIANDVFTCLRNDLAPLLQPIYEPPEGLPAEQRNMLRLVHKNITTGGVSEQQLRKGFARALRGEVKAAQVTWGQVMVRDQHFRSYALEGPGDLSTGATPKGLAPLPGRRIRRYRKGYKYEHRWALYSCPIDGGAGRRLFLIEIDDIFSLDLSFSFNVPPAVFFGCTWYKVVESLAKDLYVLAPAAPAPGATMRETNSIKRLDISKEGPGYFCILAGYIDLQCWVSKERVSFTMMGANGKRQLAYGYRIFVRRSAQWKLPQHAYDGPWALGDVNG